MLRTMWAGACLLGILAGTSVALATPPRPAMKGTASGQKGPLASKQGMGGVPTGGKVSPPAKAAVPLCQLKLKDVKTNKGVWKKDSATNDPTTDPTTSDPITTDPPTNDPGP